MYRGSISSGYIKWNSDILRLCKNMMKRYADLVLIFFLSFFGQTGYGYEPCGELRVRSSVDQVIGSRGLGPWASSRGCTHQATCLANCSCEHISSLIPALIFWYLSCRVFSENAAVLAIAAECCGGGLRRPGCWSWAAEAGRTLGQKLGQARNKGGKGFGNLWFEKAQS